MKRMFWLSSVNTVRILYFDEKSHNYAIYIYICSYKCAYICLYMLIYIWKYIWTRKYCDCEERRWFFLIHQGPFIYQVMLANDWSVAWVLFLWSEDEKVLGIMTVISGWEKTKSEKLIKVRLWWCHGWISQACQRWLEEKEPTLTENWRGVLESLWSLVLQAITTTKLGQD